MRTLTAILLFFCFNANATIYYVSNSGNDTNNGTSTSTTWRTIAKVNSSTFSPGDYILFKSGDTWNERLNPPSSGSASNFIIFGSYDTGLKPLITGFQSLSGFVNTGGNIWEATATNSVKQLNTVLIGGTLATKGRYPNSTYLNSNNAATTQSRLVGTGFTGTPDYTGGELVTTGHSWIIDVNKISSQSVDTLNVATAFTYAVYNYNFFVQNLPFLCDRQNDWAYDSTTKLLSVYSTSSPAVKISTIDTLVFMNHKSYIFFDGLAFTGANKIAIDIDTSNHITIQNCNFDNHGRTGIYGQMSTYANIKNDSLTNIQSNAIFIVRGCDYDSVTNNYIKNIGIKQGMGESGNGTYLGVFAQGDSSIITKNRVDSIGYAAIQWNGLNSLIKYNYITNYLAAKNDGGGIYTGGGGTTNSMVEANICINGIMDLSPGIYMDFSTDYVTVYSNTVSGGKLGAVLFNSPNHINFINNTIVNNEGAAFYYSIGGGGSQTIKHNIFYSKDSNQYVFFNYYTTVSGSEIDSNYYLRPQKEDLKFRIEEHLTSFSLDGWVIETGYDVHSVSTPSGISSIEGTLYINPSSHDSTIIFPGTKIDAKGNIYYATAKLKPYQSKLLFWSPIPLPSELLFLRKTLNNKKKIISL